MRIDEMFASREEPVFSFEFFPPKTDDGERGLDDALTTLAPLDPGFVSVTWGAGGSTRSGTIEIVSDIRRRHGLEAMAHFTCAGATVDELHRSLQRMRDEGIQNILALRGDPPPDSERFEPVPGGLSYASELTALVAQNYDFTILGACYPEVHREAPDRDSDLRRLREKVDAGARVLITQLFFDNRDYFDFVSDARAAGVNVPIVPGILPVRSVPQVRRFTALCGASIPRALDEQLSDCGSDAAAVERLGGSWALDQCRELLRKGAPGIHFYTVNQASPTAQVVRTLRAERPWLAVDAGVAPGGAVA
ncbi:MAG: methylenetetrahydrofolate reductase [NAD(P)H] [Miltoncostaeaceae bacterium]